MRFGSLPVEARTLVFPDETSQNAFMDFSFHEYRVKDTFLRQMAGGEESAREAD